MNKVEFFRKIMIWALVLLLSVPTTLFAQANQEDTGKYSQEQLDQMLAPIALYPDALLAQVLMASTYPLEVVLADRWVRENQNLKGDRLSNALDNESWDVSVKALVPFPAVLAMMSEKMEWTQMVGNAFLAQEEDVMATVQQLRQRAYNAGNLTSTGQQLVTRENDVIKIVPRNPAVVYVPVYDPWWVYGPWWWLAHPPYVVYPYSASVVIAPGFIWFGAGFFVGAFWGSSWGHWDWHHHHIYVNTHRWIHVKRPHIKTRNIKTKIWVHNPVHRRGVAYSNRHTRERFGKRHRNEVKNRRLDHGFNRAPGGDINKAKARTVRSDSLTVRQAPRKTTTIRVRSLPDKEASRKTTTIKSRSLPGKQVSRDVPAVRSGSLPGKQVQRKTTTIRSRNLPDKQTTRKAPAVRSGSFSVRQTPRKDSTVRSGSLTVKQAPRKTTTIRSRNLPDRQTARKAPVVRSGNLTGKRVQREVPTIKSGNLSDKQVQRKGPAVRSGSQHGRSAVRNERERYNTPGRFDAARGFGFRRGR
jgi:hypothetical protein